MCANWPQRALVTLLVMGAASAVARGAVPPQPTPATPVSDTAPSPQDIQKLIIQLADSAFATRDVADHKLRQIGWPAMASLIVARDASTDEESKARLGVIIDEICWNTDGLPSEEAQAVQRVRTMVDPSRPAPNGNHVDLRDHQVASLVVMRAMEIQQPHGFWSTFERSAEVDQSIANLKRQSRWDEVEWTLYAMGCFPELAAVAQEHGDVSRFLMAAEVLDRSLDVNIRPYNRGVALPVIMTLARSGREEALKLAQSHGERHYVIQILAERQAWQALADFLNPPLEPGEVFVRAAALQFLGKSDDANHILDEPLKGDRNSVLANCNQALLLGRADLAFDRVRSILGEEDAVDVLLVQRRYAQAFSFYANSKTKKDVQGVDYEYQLLPALIRLNEPARAAAIIQKYVISGEATKPNTLAFLRVNAADCLLGNSDAVGARLTESNIMSVMNGRWEECVTWTDTLRPNMASVAEEFTTINRILQEKLSADEWRRMADSVTIPDRKSDFRGRRSVALLYIALHLARLGLPDLAFKYVDQYVQAAPNLPPPSAASPDHAHPFTDILLLGNWTLSAHLLDGAASRSVPDPVYMYLDGLAHEKLGDLDTARKLKREAEDRLGGDSERRLFLAQTLYRLGETAAAETEARPILDLEIPFSYTRLEAHRILANVERDRGNFSEALQHLRLGMFDAFCQCAIDVKDCIQITQNSTYCQARVALQRNDRPAAVQSAVQLLTLDPEDLDLTIPLINAFQQAKLPDQARSLANLNRGFLEITLHDFPNSHLHHFLIAKLDIRSGFTNDQTSVHLQKARQLAPGNLEYQKLVLP